MAHAPRLLVLFAFLLSSLSLSLAASSTSFCKCTCFTNSTIIQLSGISSSHDSSTTTPHDTPPSGSKASQTRGTCSDCNKAFCLSYNLPICKGAKEEDVFTQCFQRDSAKDEAVVFVFIASTVGLLVYAGIRPWIERWSERWRERRSYMPVANPSGADES